MQKGIVFSGTYCGQSTLGEMKNISFIHYYREFGGNMGTHTDLEAFAVKKKLARKETKSIFKLRYQVTKIH